MATAPQTRTGGSLSRSTAAARNIPVSAAQDGWMTPPWASGTSRKPVVLITAWPGPPSSASVAPRPQPTPLRSRAPCARTLGRNASPAQT